MKLKLLYKQAFYEHLVKTLIEEGVYDKNIFKAVFLAGGPGSGKSYISDALLSGYGLKVVDVDKPTTHYMNKAGMSLKMRDDSPERDIIRNKAKQAIEQQSKYWIDGRLGLIIDGTGKDPGKIKKKADELKELGYDVFLISVLVADDIASKRNNSRDRTIPQDVFDDIWSKIRSSLQALQDYFGSNWRLIDNSREFNGYNEFKNVHSQVDKSIQEFLRQPIKNPLAKKWIDQELEAKKINVR